MKPALLKAVPNPEFSFIVRKDTGKEMKNNWHYHPDCELLYVRRSTGTWLVGDYVGRFTSGDIILIGPNLPHSFRHEYEYVMDREGEPGEAVVVLFHADLPGPAFMDLPEIHGIRNIVNLSERGLKLGGTARKEAAAILENIQFESPGRRLLNLLSILQMLAEKNEYEILASKGFVYDHDKIDNARLSAIFEYTFNNYQNLVTIEQIASLVNMGKHTFCRYFKEKTRKTYIQFLMEVRIGKACRLLQEDDMSIAEVGYTCGYNSLSHFNRQFKFIKGKSPLEYKHEYLNLLKDGWVENIM